MPPVAYASGQLATGTPGPRLTPEELGSGPPRTSLTLQRFPETELTARNQPPHGWEAAKPTNESRLRHHGHFRPAGPAGDQRRETSAGLSYQRPSSAQARAKVPPPRAPAKTRRASRKSEPASGAPPSSSAPRPGVRGPVPVGAPPPRGELARRLNIRDWNAHFRWRLFPSPLRPRLWLSVRQRHLAPRCSSTRGWARFLPSEPSRDAAVPGRLYAHRQKGGT